MASFQASSEGVAAFAASLGASNFATPGAVAGEAGAAGGVACLAACAGEELGGDADLEDCLEEVNRAAGWWGVLQAWLWCSMCRGRSEASRVGTTHSALLAHATTNGCPRAPTHACTHKLTRACRCPCLLICVSSCRARLLRQDGLGQQHPNRVVLRGAWLASLRAGWAARQVQVVVQLPCLRQAPLPLMLQVSTQGEVGARGRRARSQRGSTCVMGCNNSPQQQRQQQQQQQLTLQGLSTRPCKQ